MLWLLIFVVTVVLLIGWATRRYNRHGGTRGFDHMSIASEHDMDPGHQPWSQSEPGGRRERPRE